MVEADSSMNINIIYEVISSSFMNKMSVFGITSKNNQGRRLQSTPWWGDLITILGLICLFNIVSYFISYL
jgi:hypothetical protein